MQSLRSNASTSCSSSTSTSADLEKEAKAVEAKIRELIDKHKESHENYKKSSGRAGAFDVCLIHAGVAESGLARNEPRKIARDLRSRGLAPSRVQISPPALYSSSDDKSATS